MTSPVRPYITLTTDFGLKDHFVGTMKGVIINISPFVRIIDISHQITPQDIDEAGFVLECAYKYFPPYTINVVVVDPEVGSARKPLLVVSDRYYFIAPDNGVLSFLYNNEEEPVKVIEINAEHYFLESPGFTFHGRDIFAPVAAWLSKGIDITNFGIETENYVKRAIPKPEVFGKDLIRGRVAHIDKFGNIISNIKRSHIDELAAKTGKGKFEIHIKDIKIGSLNQFYAQGDRGKPNAVINSNGYVEIYCYMGNAKEALKAVKGDEVGVVIK
ncbi:MAG: SAM-dependent chlorinase/fluorinase [Nitrospirota bacterium]